MIIKYTCYKYNQLTKQTKSVLYTLTHPEFSWMRRLLDNEYDPYRSRDFLISIARHENNIVGWACGHITLIKYKEDFPEPAIEYSVFVNPEYRLKGIGGCLISAIRKEFPIYKEIAFPRNKEGIIFYKNNDIIPITENDLDDEIWIEFATL